MSNDYLAYWGAARLAILGSNPYDAVALASVEATTCQLSQPVLMMWNPPWTIALNLPFAMLPFCTAKWVWLAVSIILMLVCGAALWNLYAPSVDHRYWLGVLLVASYLPALLTLWEGNSGPWLLLGITGFLLGVQAKRDYLAGVALALLLVKPHIVFLFIAGVGWWVLRERRWKVLLGGLAATALASALVMLFSPDIFKQYLSSAVGPQLRCNTATLGYWLRVLFGKEFLWLQFLPPVLGFILFGIWLFLRKGRWDWLHIAPVLLLASSITALFGWGHDQLALLPVVVLFMLSQKQLHVRQQFVFIGLYVLVESGMFMLTIVHASPPTYYWHSLAMAGLYVYQRFILHRQSLKTGN
ncbi:MAG: glycosyltransferase family 87 protein [Anaerolineae bacterium]